MTGDSNGFKNVDVVHRWFGWSAFVRPEAGLTARRFRPLGLSRRYVLGEFAVLRRAVAREERAGESGAAPRCSPRGTSG
jgi:hypothetical protein